MSSGDALRPSKIGDSGSSECGQSQEHCIEQTSSLNSVLPGVGAHSEINQGPTYDPRRKLDSVRASLAARLVTLLGLVIVLEFILFATQQWTKISDDVLHTTLAVIFSSIFTLVSAATGYYFGTREEIRDQASQQRNE